MVALKTTARIDRSHTLAVVLPQCGVEAGEYEVLVVLDKAAEPAEPPRVPLTFSNHRLASPEGQTWSRGEIYDDDGR